MNIIKLSSTIYTDNYIKKIKSIIRGYINYKNMTKLHTFLYTKQNELILLKQPDFIFKILRPYINKNKNKKEITDIIISHYQWFNRTFSEKTKNTFYQQGVFLNSIYINDDIYHITLNYDTQYRHEGELTITLLDNNNVKYYSLTFTIDDNQDAFIGGVQGNAQDNGFSKKFTKAFYGMRPKSFIIESVRTLLKSLKINNLYAVKNSTHIAHKKLSMDYNKLWEEHDGVEYNDNYYKLSLTMERRTIENIKRPKRKMYRERYEWLDDYQQEIENKINSLR